MTDLNISEKEKDGNPDWSKRQRLAAPKELRRHEVREGGFIVIERTTRKRLLRPAAWPIEVASLAEAYKAANKLRAKFPDREFCVFEQVGALAP